MTDKKGTMSGTSGGAAPAQRAWESMSLTQIGSFGDVLRGATGPSGDGGAKRP